MCALYQNLQIGKIQLSYSSQYLFLDKETWENPAKIFLFEEKL